MNYTNFALFGLGVMGIILHNLIQLNKINRRNNGKINIVQYLKLEIFSILINLIAIIVALLVKHEIVQLEQAGKYLGLAFVAIGYMGQSIFVWLFGKAEKKIKEN
jgi:hypothetical protein